MTNLQIFWLVVSFVFGATFGSFLNVCIYRMPIGKSLIWPPSHCPSCFQPVGFYNIPILGWFILGGKCRRCGKPFSIRYALVELLTGALWAAFFALLVIVRGAPLPVFFAFVILAMMMLVASFVDLAWKIIPQTLTTFGIVLAVIFSAAYPRLHAQYIGFHPGGGRYMEALSRVVTRVPPLDGLLASLGGMMAGALLIIVVRFLGTIAFRREAMGLGDAKLMAVIGGFLGWYAIPLIFILAAFIGSVVGLVTYLRTRDRELPLGPFLSLAAIVVMLWGNEIVRWWVVDLMGWESVPRIISYGMAAGG